MSKTLRPDGPVDTELIIKEDPEAVAVLAADNVTGWAQAVVRARGRFRIALAGGSTPTRLYELLTAEPYRSQLPWRRLELYWGDERFLPAGDPGRNDASVLPLLAATGIPPNNVHPVPYLAGETKGAGMDSGDEETEPGSSTSSTLVRFSNRRTGLELAAQDYDRLLREQARPGEPLLDLVLLGLGTDGHVASLFPETAALEEQDALAVPNTARYEDRHPQRVTLTFPAINAAERILFLVTGESKREILGRVLGPAEDPPLPAQRVKPGSGKLIWLVDRASTGLMHSQSDAAHC